MFTKAQISKEKIKELLDEAFPNEEADFCGCYEGDLYNYFPAAQRKLIDLIYNLVQETN